MKVRRNDIKRSPWITKGLMKSINRKNESKLNPQNIRLRNELKQYSDELLRFIHTKKALYYRTEINSDSTQPDKLWKTLKELQGRPQQVRVVIIKDEIKVKKTERKEIAEAFINIGANLVRSIKKKLLESCVNSIIIASTN